MHETRSFNAANNTTISMRHKEEANDYRYFPEPDLQPIIITEKYISEIKEQLPPLPDELFLKFTNEFGLSEYDAIILTDEKEIALYYNELCSFTKNYKSAANFMNGSVKSYLNENGISINEFSISTERLASLINIVADKKISNTIATSKVFPEMIKTNDFAETIAKQNNWIQESSSSTINKYIEQAILKYPEKVIEYQAGKKGLIGLFMGEVMKLSKVRLILKLQTNY